MIIYRQKMYGRWSKAPFVPSIKSEVKNSIQLLDENNRNSGIFIPANKAHQLQTDAHDDSVRFALRDQYNKTRLDIDRLGQARKAEQEAKWDNRGFKDKVTDFIKGNVNPHNLDPQLFVPRSGQNGIANVSYLKDYSTPKEGGAWVRDIIEAKNKPNNLISTNASIYDIGLSVPGNLHTKDFNRVLGAQSRIRATKLTNTSYPIGYNNSSLRIPSPQAAASANPKPNIIIPGQQNKPSAKLII